MRLLQRDSAGNFTFTRDYETRDVPRYAILSHTWGGETDEVTYDDIKNGTGGGKPGFDKIKLGIRQAETDGLKFFWIDTCCVDRSNHVELSEAINSMFRWYSKAAKCYVYLSDVPRVDSTSGDKSIEEMCKRDLRDSRWFRRGWTLQELLAPSSVEFFSRDFVKLGTKVSLERQINEITRLPARALRASSFTEFTQKERFLWQQDRETYKDEDLIYSLLGIFGVSMPIIYGEGKDEARRRLEEQALIASKDHRLMTTAGARHEDFQVSFSLTEAIEIEQFVARSSELQEIRKALMSDGTRRTVVLHGLGGMGKTQLAIAYATRYKNDYSAILWITIKDKDSAKLSFSRVAMLISRDQPSANALFGVEKESNLDHVVEAVKAWLSRPDNSRWLMIFDNYDNPKVPDNTDSAAVDIRKFLPEAYQGSVLVTSRSSEVVIGHRVHIKKLSDLQDSLAILSNTSGRDTTFDDTGAMELARKLDGLPLALATAGTYLRQSSISFARYLSLYEASWAKLQKKSPRVMSYENQQNRAMYSTWQISFDQIKQRNPLSANLLCLWAYFDNQDLWYELLCHGNDQDPKWILELTEDEMEFHDAIRVLFDHGMVEINPGTDGIAESGGYSVHSCVHSWMVTVLNHGYDMDLARLALRCIGSHIPFGDSAECLFKERRLLNHATSWLRTTRSAPIIEGMVPAYHSLATLHAKQSKLHEAGDSLDRAMRVCEQALEDEQFGGDAAFRSKNYAYKLKTLARLGDVYYLQGRLDDAEMILQQALQGQEEVLGVDHVDTLETVSTVGGFFHHQGRLDEAEKMYERVLEERERSLGAGDGATLQILNRLASLYCAQGRLEESEKMYMRGLRGLERISGRAGDTRIIFAMRNLGILYSKQGRHDDALKVIEQVLQDCEAAFGSNHMATLDTLGYLAWLYVNEGKMDEGVAMLERALEGKRIAVGASSIWTIATACELGLSYVKQGRFPEAEAVYEWVSRRSQELPPWCRTKIDLLGGALSKMRAKEDSRRSEECASPQPTRMGRRLDETTNRETETFNSYSTGLKRKKNYATLPVRRESQEETARPSDSQVLVSQDPNCANDAGPSTVG